MEDKKTYKAEKEAFVSGLSGGSITEINVVTAVAPIAYVLFAVLQTRLGLFKSYGALQLFTDFFICCGTALLSVTLYAHQPLLLNVLIVSPAVLVWLSGPPTAPVSKAKPTAKSSDDPNPLPRKPFLTVYRGSMMVITCVAILAVDFRVFPRRFAKVENWGTSLMDIGVGSFVFSSGVISARSVVKQSLASSTAASSVPFGERMKMALRSSVPLLVLGFVRLAMVKGVDYAEHVTEYGIHWNFFFTLGLLPPFVAFLQSVSPVVRNPTLLYTALSLLVAGGYQAVLQATGLQEYVLVGDRHKYGLLGMNKEGASSFAGYLAIFLSGMATGTYVLRRDSGGPKLRGSRVMRSLAGWSVFWIAMFYASSEQLDIGLGVSRRLANFQYFLWVTAFNTAQMSAFYLVERVFFTPKQTAGLGENDAYRFSVPRVLEAFNRNGLAVFLVANLLTGLVNISIRTLEVDRITTMAILSAYMEILTMFAVGLDMKNITIKL